MIRILNWQHATKTPKIQCNVALFHKMLSQIRWLFIRMMFHSRYLLIKPLPISLLSNLLPLYCTVTNLCWSVFSQESEIKWASRWDTYLLMNDDQIHWFSIINSLLIVLFLSGMVAMMMMRTLYRDIANYNQLETQDEAQEETGWKLVSVDAFRPPINSGLLCVYVGTGVQIFAMTLVTMTFALLGFLSPSN